MRSTWLMGLVLFGGVRAFAEVGVDCQALLFAEAPELSVAQRLSAPRALLLQNDLGRARAVDPRLGLLELISASPTLNRLDHFTSPALLYTSVLDERRSRAFVEYLKLTGARGRVIADAFRLRAEVPPHVDLLLTLIESRYRTAYEIVGFAMKTKAGQRPAVDASDYVRGLRRTLVTVVNELRAQRTHRTVFANFDFGAMDWTAVTRELEASLASSPLLAFKPSENSHAFRHRFIAEIDSNRDPIQNLDAMGLVLERRLAEVPVGLLHRTADLTSSVRFGRYLFFGNAGDYRSSVRLKYLRSRVGDSTTTEVTLKLTNHQKKLVAVRLDRQHQALDPVFGLSEPRGRHFNTCGSYAPLTFMKCGVPITSPAYFTPGATSFSLAVQRFLGVGNVERARISITKEFVSVPEDILVTAVHEVFPTAAEFTLYVAMLEGIDRLIQLML